MLLENRLLHFWQVIELSAGDVCSLFTEQPVNRLSTFRIHTFRRRSRLAFISELDLVVIGSGKTSVHRSKGSVGSDGLKRCRSIRPFM